jgi:Na+-driven multidrug efflux pump
MRLTIGLAIAMMLVGFALLIAFREPYASTLLNGPAP